MLAGAPWRRGWLRHRGETVAGRGADADGWGLPGRDATGRGAPLRNGRARRGAEASGRGFWQASARLASGCAAGKEMHDGRGVARLARRCTTGKEMHEGRGVVRQARKCTMGEALHDGQAPPRQGNRWHIGPRAVARYFCLGGALRGYILSITSIGTPRIRCNCLFVAE